MKSPFTLLLVPFALALAACGGSGGQPTQQPGLPTSTGQASPTAPAQATASPAGQPGTGSTTVVLTGGPDAGTYAGSASPNCSLGLIGPGGWGVQYSVADGPADELSSLQMVVAAAGMADDEDAFFQGTELLMTVTIGTLFDEAARDYEVAVRTDASDQESSGTGSATITDTGSTAVIHATGTTAEGVTIDATVNCPTVVRQ